MPLSKVERERPTMLKISSDDMEIIEVTFIKSVTVFFLPKSKRKKMKKSSEPQEERL